MDFDPVTPEAELGKCSRSTPMLNEREVTGEELETAEEYLRSFQANSSVRASATASENRCKAGQLAAASGVGLVKQESCEDDLLIHSQDLESCQEEEGQDKLVMHSTARTYDKQLNVRHSYTILTPARSKLHFGGSACECDSVLGPVFSQLPSLKVKFFPSSTCVLCACASVAFFLSQRWRQDRHHRVDRLKTKNPRFPIFWPCGSSSFSQ